MHRFFVNVVSLAVAIAVVWGLTNMTLSTPTAEASNFTHRRGNQGGSVGSTLGRIVGNTPYIPGVDYAEGAIATSVLNTATDIAASVKAKDEMALDYQLLAVGSTKPLLERKEKRRAKTDGEDLLTPLVEAAADAVGTVISK